MLGDCEITGEEHIPRKMTKDEIQSLPGDQSLPSPPPAKKLKQARLPFKILDQKPVEPKITVTPTSAKKRKPSDGGVAPQKACKIQRNDENGRSRNPPKHGDAENEVSSSSEAENQCKIANANKTDKIRKGLERFVQSTQQLEVSTSSEVVDLTDDASNGTTEEKVCSNEHTKPTVVGDTKSTEKEPEKSNEGEVEEVESETEKSVETKLPLETDLNDSVLSNHVLDTTNTSVQSKTSDDESNDESQEGTSQDDATPSSAVTPSQTQRKRPPLSAKKASEREAKRLEREKLKAEKLRLKEMEKQKKEEEKKEKERIKEELRLEKEKQKQEEKEKKEAEKNKKEKERLEKLAEKERDKLEKQKAKEEERKKKQEAIDAKAEEKEAERKRKEEKQKVEEEKSRKIQHSQAMFKSFFKKVEKTDTPPKVTENVGSFAAFQVLENMKMAPVIRVSREELPQRCEELDKLMEEQCTDELYVAALRNGAMKPGSCLRTWPLDDVIVVDPTEPPKPNMKKKLYQFHENYRPAYFGTWRKRSKTVSPRNPLKKDEVYLDYDIDSDDEWEEEEPGESLSNSEGEGEEQPAEADDDEDDDGFFVPHGYLSDGEGCEEDEEDCNPEKLKMRQMVKAKNFEAEMKKTTEVLKMLVIGCCWLQADKKSEAVLQPYKAEILTDETPIDIGQESSQDDKGNKTSKEKRGMKIQGVPEEAMSHLIRLVHGNLYSLKKLIKEFIVFWRRREKGEKGQNTSTGSGQDETGTDDAEGSSKNPDHSPSDIQEDIENEEDITCAISKRQLDLKIRSIACYEKRADHRIKCWYVHDEVLTKYNMKDVPVPTNWSWITKPGKVKHINEEAASPNPAPKKESSTVNPNQGSIKQFAVPGVVQNLVPLPSVQSVPKPSPATPGSQHKSPAPVNKKTPKRITPITLFCAKGPSLKPTVPQSREEMCSPVTKGASQEDDDDCMIVDAPFAQPAPSKSQPTLTDMFSYRESK